MRLFSLFTPSIFRILCFTHLNLLLMELPFGIDKIATFYKELPNVVKNVLTRGFLLWASFSIVFYYILLPNGEVVKEFTHLTSFTTIWMLNKFYSSGFVIGSYKPLGDLIKLGNRNVLYIMDTCSGFKLYVLYLGFLICAPGIMKSKAIYSFVGILLIFVLNILRCYAVAVLVLNRPEWVYFAHHYVFTIIVYSTIFLLWFSFLKIRKPIHQTK